MTSDAVTVDHSEPGPLYCYRHPDRETYVRCGRCDQPICMGCAMQGPVGMRCKTCGTPSRDPLTMMTPQQLALGGLVAIGAGTIGGFIGIQMGFFLALCLGPFAGGFISEAVQRVTGYKRGTRIKALVLGGILAGVLIGAAIYVQMYFGSYVGEEGAPGMEFLYTTVLTGALVYVVAAMIGAYSRLR
ncbi:MAG TPA: hypothetical protein VGQ02_09615 [Candidatus Limnocylindrales bacterium]|nr:hypothetical protein [Candidatus Limnocylindrales bacterium]